MSTRGSTGPMQTIGRGRYVPPEMAVTLNGIQIMERISRINDVGVRSQIMNEVNRVSRMAGHGGMTAAHLSLIIAKHLGKEY